MSAVPARPCSPASRLQPVADLGERQAAVLRQPQDQARIHAARPRRHHQPLERREAHRRVDRSAVAHGGERCAGAEVAGDHAKATLRHGRELGRARARVRVRQPVEPVPADAPPGPPGCRKGVGRGRGGQRRVERRVEAGDRPGPPGARGRTASSAASAAGWWSGARSVSERMPSTMPASTSTGPVNRVPPCTIRWPTASTGPMTATADASWSIRSSPSSGPRSAEATIGVVRVQHPQLQAARPRS